MMLQIFPPSVVIPLHGITQFFSNASRALILRSFIVREYVVPFTIGSLLGVIIFIPLITLVDHVMGSLILGVFILVATWRPKYLKLRSVHATISGAITGGLGLILGAIGPPSDVRPPERKLAQGTNCGKPRGRDGVPARPKGCCVHSHWDQSDRIRPRVNRFVLGAASGTFVGTKILKRISDDRFRMLLNVVLTILALRMIYENLQILALG